MEPVPSWRCSDLSWRCSECTYVHADAEIDFLACGVCGAPRDANGEAERAGAETDDDRAGAPGLAPLFRPRAASAAGRKAPRRGHGGGGGGGEARASPAARTSATGPPRAPACSLLRLPTDPITVRRRPAGAPSGSRFTSTAIPDADAPRHVPAVLVRNVLPAALADALLEALMRDGEAWHRGHWTVFGKTHVNPRTTRTFGLATEPTEAAAAAQHGAGGAGLAGGEYGDLGDVLADLGDVRAPSDSTPSLNDDNQGAAPRLFSAPPELDEAAKVIKAAVHLVCPWSAWRPSFAFGNRYASGEESVGFHSDFLMALGPRPIIAGLSLGAARRFEMKSVANEDVVSFPTSHNSLIVMFGESQELWQHAVPRCKVKTHCQAGLSRYSLTFRQERPAFAASHAKKCKCGRPAALKASKGKYYLACNPAQRAADREQGCDFFEWCPAALIEAKRLLRIEEDHARPA
ncbi:hypothetical protein M885DRAFT_514228 [Pelagophyceae sp. CCMP2097]|nr:hypothetical protein M885DRAFT_514228 [Pelagophyceae sp. CCMP2097]